MKVCTKCAATKSLAEFGKKAGTRDGLRTYCKECHRADVSAWQKANREAATKRQAEWRKANVERSRAHGYAWRQRNQEQVKAASIEWHRNNSDRHRIYKLARRARRKGAEGKFSVEQIKNLYRLQRGHCAICANPLPADFHRDHIVPLVRGGSNDILNIQLLCPSCNVRKGTKDPIEYAQKLGRLI